MSIIPGRRALPPPKITPVPNRAPYVTRRPTRAMSALAGGWGLGSATLLFFDQWLRERLWIFSLAVVALWLLVGLCLLVLFATRSIRGGSRDARRAAALLILAGVGSWVGGERLQGWGARWLQHTRFESRLPAYEATVAALQRRPLPGGWHRNGPAGGFAVDSGPPLRVAFPWPGGIVDNWQGVVHDPTGRVLQAQRFRRDWSNFADPALQPVKRLFGGDMYHCEHLRGPWYFCRFT